MAERESGFSQAGYLNENYRFFHLKDTAGQERDFHFHEFDKMVLLLGGKVDYAVEDRYFAMNPGEILLVRHHTIHKAIIDVSEPYERVIIYIHRSYFDAMMPDAGLMDSFDRADSAGSYLLSPGTEQQQEIRTAVSRLEQYQKEPGVYGRVMRDSFMLQLLAALSRISAGSRKRPEDPGYDPKIAGSLSYINTHLTEELSVERLAENAYLSRYHFMRLFKEQTGQTVHGYIRQKRLALASRMIREGTPAAEAAEGCGFKDYSSFYKAFRDTFGISPSVLKK